jgi:hypothetical protein
LTLPLPVFEFTIYENIDGVIDLNLLCHVKKHVLHELKGIDTDSGGTAYAFF